MIFQPTGSFIPLKSIDSKGWLPFNHKATRKQALFSELLHSELAFMDGPALNDTSLIRIAVFIALSPLTLLMLLVILLWKVISFSADATDFC